MGVGAQEKRRWEWGGAESRIPKVAGSGRNREI